MRIKPWMRYASTICLYLFLSGMIVIGISEKRNLHTDEVLTYILANNSYDEEITLAPEMGKTYEPAGQVWQNVMTVQPETEEETTALALHRETESESDGSEETAAEESAAASTEGMANGQ